MITIPHVGYITKLKRKRLFFLGNILLYIKEGCLFVGLAYQEKDVVFRFIIEYSSLMDFDP
jgi:hypothetical protein